MENFNTPLSFRVIDVISMHLEPNVIPTTAEMMAISQVEKSGLLLACRIERRLGTPANIVRVGTIEKGYKGAQEIIYHVIIIDLPITPLSPNGGNEGEEKL